MAESTSTPELGAARREARHEKFTEAVEETGKTVADIVKGEQEFHHTGIRPDPGAISVEGVALGVLGDAIKWVAGIARDEIEFRATGHRPDHNSLEALQAREAGRPLRGALAHTLTEKEIGLGSDDFAFPIVPGDAGKK